MARYSDATAGWKLSANLSVLSGNTGPFTIVFWFKSGDITQSNAYILISYQATKQWAIIYEFVNNTIEFFSPGAPGTDPRIDSGITIPDTNWHHIAYRKDGAGASGWDKFLDGSKTQINGNIDFTLGTALTDFILFASNSGDEVDGSLFDVGIYTSSLTDAQIIALAKGYSTRLLNIKPAFAWELSGRKSPEPDIYNAANNLTVTNVVYADNPRMIYPARTQIGVPAAIGDGSYQQEVDPVINLEATLALSIKLANEALINLEASNIIAIKRNIEPSIDLEVNAPKKLIWTTDPSINLEIANSIGITRNITSSINLEASLIPKIRMIVEPNINLEVAHTSKLKRAGEPSINLEASLISKIKKALEALINLEVGFNLKLFPNYEIDPSINLEASLVSKFGLVLEPSINLEVLNIIGIQRALAASINLEINNEVNIKRALEALINLEIANTSGFTRSVDPSIDLEVAAVFVVLFELLAKDSTITILIAKDSGIKDITENSAITILLDKDSVI